MSIGVAAAAGTVWSQFLAAPAYSTSLLQAAHEGVDPMQIAGKPPRHHNSFSLMFYLCSVFSVHVRRVFVRQRNRLHGSHRGHRFLIQTKP
jgi:hypothetical protein